jgi:serine/threonine protein phosphatase 1
MRKHGIKIPVQDVFVTSDIHGHDTELKGLLKSWNPEKELLLFLGDYCDRGDDSYGAFLTVKELVEAGKAIAIGGNHEELFLSFLDAPETEWQVFYGNGGEKTIQSFYPGVISPRFSKTPTQWAEMIKKDFAEIVAFLRDLPFYIEMGDWLFVHAGINPFLMDWRDTSGMHFRWIREMFYLRKNETGKRIMFGHTPIPHLPYGNGLPMWTNLDQTLFGIDGGMGSNRLLNGVRIQDGEIQEMVVQLFNDDSIVVSKENLFKREILV